MRLDVGGGIEIRRKINQTFVKVTVIKKAHDRLFLSLSKCEEKYSSGVLTTLGEVRLGSLIINKRRLESR
jgi:hypothetical protein